jgi:S1-C subfamily serine protease
MKLMKLGAKMAQFLGSKKTLVISTITTLSLLTLSLIFLHEQLHQDYLLSYSGSQIVKLSANNNPRSGGTGFAVIAPSGRVYTLSNGHVCEISKNGLMDAWVPGTERSYSLRILEISKETDLCLLEAMPGYTGIPLADAFRPSENVTVLGHPLLQPLTFSVGKYVALQTIKVTAKVNVEPDECEGDQYEFHDTSGTVYDLLFGIKSFCLRKVKAVLTNLVIYPGNSGSPVLNFYGNVAGVVFAASNETHYGYVIPIEDIVKFLSIY